MSKKPLSLVSKGAMALGVMALSASMAMTDIDSVLYMTNILAVPEHAPFDGTVAPMAESVNWVKLSSDEWDATYKELDKSNKLVELPWYDPSNLKISTDDLQWGDKDDDAIRNQKITYSTSYMADYRGGPENSGSHLAVDIKAPNGTPIRAIANGSVIKAAEQSSGFGHHIVIQHNNVPEDVSGSKKGTLYSSYSHMSDVDVDVGDVVKKGEWIGKSGDTGTATTPHLHFQIDNDEAPWHPFWPFTWQEAIDEGLDFFSAVNAGLGQDTALKTTVNPMKYVQNHMDGDDGEEYIEEEVEEVVEPEEVEAESYIEEEVDEDPVEVIEEVEEVIEIVEEVERVMSIEVDTKDKYYVGGNSDFTVSLRDQFGEPFIGDFDHMKITSVDGNIAAKNVFVQANEFDGNGELHNSFVRMDPGTERIEIQFNGETLRFDNFQIIDNQSSFADVPADHEYSEAINFLVDEGIITGYEDNTFRPENSVNRVEALKFILESIGVDLTPGEPPFKDAKEGWYVDYLYTAYQRAIINGDPDGSYRPADTVNKAEFFKILFNGMGVDINPNVDSPPYSDVAVDAWFAPYIAYAKDLEIIDIDIEKIGPDFPMSRGEVADAIYRLMLILE